MALHRSNVGDGGGSAGGSLNVEPGPFKRWPDVVSFLCQSAWEDGKPRATGTVMLFTEAGRWKIWVHDRDAGAGAFLTGETLESVLAGLEKGLGAGSLDWREDRKGKGR